MLRALQCQVPSVIIDNLTASPSGTQNAISLHGAGHRFVFAAPGASCVLPSLSGHEATSRMMFVINDAPNSLAVFPWPGDSLNGTLNGSLSVPIGTVAILLKIDTGALLDWRGAILT
jgi:hypothetical protein